MSGTIGERITFIRESFNISQDVVATYLGMSQGNLSNIEAGRVSPNLYTICCLSLLFDLSVDWLVLGVGENPDIRRSYDTFVNFNRETFQFDEESVPISEEKVESFIKGFAARLKSYREQYKFSQKDIISKTGLAQSSYTLIEQAKSNISLEVLEKILKGLDLSGDWLLFGIEPNQRNIIFPSDILMCKDETEINQLYETRVEHEVWKKAHKVCDAYIIAKEGIIPHRNLTVEQLEPVIQLISYIQRKNDEKIDVSKELELLQNLIDCFRMKSKGKDNEAGQKALLKDLNDFFQKK